MLRLWSERRELRPRYEFVLSGMRAVFPDVFEDLDFVTAGQTISLRIYRPGDESPVSVTHEADGLVSMLVQLCAIASADDGGIVAIDEPERSLHPFAIRGLLRRARQHARKHGLTVLFTTHSSVVLNEFREEPDRLFVMQPGEPVLPVALSRYRNPEWLANFELGDLYANCEFGASAA
jgi:predicted ATPase